jgi:hypothetical protein
MLVFQLEIKKKQLKKPWKVIKNFDFNNIDKVINNLKRKKIHLSPWVENVFKNYKSKLTDADFPLKLYIIQVKDLDLKKPSKLEKIYKLLKKQGFELVPPEVSLIARIYYKEQKTGEWLRFATPFRSLVDSDGVPHLPKLGKALRKYFIETYWSYPKAIFHPHNKFVVRKK